MIRKANQQDAQAVIALLALALDHFVYRLSGEGEKEEALRVLQGFYVKEGNRLSYENIYLYEKNGSILGAICFYDGARGKELDLPLNENLARLGREWRVFQEGEQEAFYLDSVTVHLEARGKGVAKALIQKAIEVARQNGKKLSLIVEHTNPNAKRLYESLSFQTQKQKEFYGHLYDYMVC